MENVITALNKLVWGVPMLSLILGTGIFLTLGLKFMPILKISFAFKQLLRGRTGNEELGELSGFQALMTSLSATIGTGNIAGVATAIALGGPGALFWMWCTALVGMATKYAEAVLAVKFRERDSHGNFCGGPMYYIKNGLGNNWSWLAIAFAAFGSIAGFGIGNTVQANSVAGALQGSFDVPPVITGLVLAALVATTLLGGVKRIGRVAALLVPAMAIAYLLIGVTIIVINIAELPSVLALVFKSAFTGSAAQGGFAGAAVWAAIRFGVARGVFSNEAGLGSAPIAHAAAQTNSPVNQGLIAMLGTFIDTLIVCSITGLVILLSGTWVDGLQGAALSAEAFNLIFQGGDKFVAIALCIFAFTTLLGWSYYCERCLVFLLGDKSIWVFRVLWVLAIPVGAQSDLGLIWLIADTLNGLMALPNLIALLLLSPVVFRLSKDYFSKA